MYSICMHLLDVILQRLRICLTMSMDTYVRISKYFFGCVCEIVSPMHMLHVLQKILNVRLRIYVCICICIYYIYIYIYIYDGIHVSYQYVCYVNVYMCKYTYFNCLYSTKESKQEIPIDKTTYM